ncbi:AAA family ATPase [Paraburkholderia sp. BCC1884]|uniref:AAA family ATPase n=1 Tax=Paraburkholderia sp. BCC1884 TaxID=2562668 RepID=UPI001183B954|nr:ATP-binding protein [Paraburkholderia sp. BCC1884]
MTCLVFFCGHAGTGKTTLAKKLLGPLMRASAAPFCLLDKDTLYGGYSAAAMSMLTGDPNDRDSPLFLEHLRDPEYRGLLDTARDNLELGVNALVVAPLSREVRERRLFDHEWLGVGDEVKLRVVWVHIAEETARTRIVERGDPNDAYKLAHWNEYRQRRFVPDGEMSVDLLMFDNTAPTASDYEALLARLVGEPYGAASMQPPLPV